MQKFSVLLAVARGACFDIGRRIKTTVLASGPLDAALTAEKLVDQILSDDREYSHATKVTFLPWGEAASLAVAA